MSRYLRPTYLIPRLIVVVLVCLFVEWGVSGLVKWRIVSSGEAMEGASIQVGRVRTSPLAPQIKVRDLQLTSDDATQHNRLVADSVQCNLDVGALLHKRFVVEHGSLRGLRIDTAPSMPGPTVTSPSADDTQKLKCFDEEVTARGRAWLEHVAAQFDRDFLADFESIRLSDELVRLWDERYVALEERVASFNERADEFQGRVRLAAGNPLRHEQTLQNLPGELDSLREELRALDGELESLAGVMEEDRRVVIAARKQDEQMVREKLQVDGAEPNALTAYLLQEPLSAALKDTLGWLRWVRRAAPTGQTPRLRRRRRGADVLFANCIAEPDLLIREMDVQGTARVAAQPVDFHGTVSNVTTEPYLNDTPIELDLFATGSVPIRLKATIDRTHQAASDEFDLCCQNLVLPSLLWGNADRFSLLAGPGPASVNVQLTLDDEQLSGNVRMVQREVRLTPEFICSSQDVPLTAALFDALPEAATVTTEVSLTGTLTEPRCKVSSDLGTQVAGAFDVAAAKAAEQYIQRLLVKSRRQVDERLALIDQKVSQARTQLQAALAEPSESLEQLADDIDDDHGLSSGEIGLRLRLDRYRR